ERLSEFKADLRSLSDYRMIRKYIIFGKCQMLSDDLYADLKAKIAEKFSIHPTEIVMVGSAKLGFSIAPHKRYREFGDRSDIDIAIVSEKLFLTMWDSLWKYVLGGGYWPALNDFREYLFQGWLRPDKLPPDDSCRIARDWWEFFRHLTRSGQYGAFKISGGL